MELFGTAGIRGPVTKITPELAMAVGRAVATRLQDSETKCVVIARDGRETGETLASAIEAGVTSGGLHVYRAGQLPTPGLAFASQGRHGIMLTASHNPPADNGIKLFVDGSEYDAEAEAEVEQLVEDSLSAAAWNQWGTTEQFSPLDSYLAAVTDYARGRGKGLDGMEVAIDCGTGMGSIATPEVLENLGAETRALNANVDGHFTARDSKPTAETLTTLRAFVREGAALGIAHDGDADRVVIVDSEGEVIHEDTVLAILAEHYVRESEAGDPVVLTTPNASRRIDERVDAAGGRVERTSLGTLHEGIAAVRDGTDDETEIVFAAEPWKHIHPELGEWIDGIASAAVFSRLVASEGLDALREPVSERPYRKESVSCPDENKASAMDRLHTTLPERFPEASVNTEYGIRLTLDGGAWTLVRPSGTEPFIRIYAESENVDQLVETVQHCVEDAIN